MFHGVVSELLLPVPLMFSVVVGVRVVLAISAHLARRGSDSVPSQWHIPRFKIRGEASYPPKTIPTELIPYSSSLLFSSGNGNGIEMQIHGIG